MFLKFFFMFIFCFIVASNSETKINQNDEIINNKFHNDFSKLMSSEDTIAQNIIGKEIINLADSMISLKIDNPKYKLLKLKALLVLKKYNEGLDYINTNCNNIKSNSSLFLIHHQFYLQLQDTSKADSINQYYLELFLDLHKKNLYDKSYINNVITMYCITKDIKSAKEFLESLKNEKLI